MIFASRWHVVPSVCGNSDAKTGQPGKLEPRYLPDGLVEVHTVQLKTEPRNYTDKALGIVRDVLREFAGPILERNLGPDHYLERARSRTFQSGFDGERAPSVDDPLFWLRVVSGDLWHSIFKHQLHSQVKVVCGDLVQMRHAWAHSEEATEGREWNASFLTRCLDLLSKVPGGKESYRDLQELREELLNDASSSAQQALEINVAQEVTTPVRPPAKRGGSKPQHPLVKDLDPDQAAVVASFLKEDPEGRVLRGATAYASAHRRRPNSLGCPSRRQDRPRSPPDDLTQP